MPNPLVTILEVVHKHMTADSDDIYVETLRLIQHAIDETDRQDYETDSDGEKIIGEVEEAVQEYDISQRGDDDEVDGEIDDDDNELDRENADDLDDDELPQPVELKGSVVNSPPVEEPTSTT